MTEERGHGFHHRGQLYADNQPPPLQAAPWMRAAAPLQRGPFQTQPVVPASSASASFNPLMDNQVPRFPVPNVIQDMETQLSTLMSRINVLERENQHMNERLKDHESLTASMQQHTPVVRVTLPTQPPRLGIFTGLKPAGGSEVHFSEWQSRVKQFLTETDDVDSPDTFRKVKASLRGIALEQVKECVTGGEILDKLTRVYGNLLTPEDMYSSFVRMSQERKETPASFFSRLWAAFNHLNNNSQFTPLQANAKIFHTFMCK